MRVGLRLLPGVRAASAAHCTLPAGRTWRAVRHQTVEEIWYFLEGRGQAGPLTFFIVTMPPWPGVHEAVRVKDHWET